MNIHGIMFKKTYSPLSQFLLSNIMFLRSHRYYVDKALGPRCVQQQKVCFGARCHWNVLCWLSGVQIELILPLKCDFVFSPFS